MGIRSRSRYLGAAVALLGAAGCASPAPTSDPGTLARTEVEALLAEWLDLWATYDLDRLPDVFWRDPGLTYFSSERRGLLRGYEALIPHHAGFGFVAGGAPPRQSLWLDEVNIVLHPGAAVVDAVWYFGDPAAPRATAQQGPVTFVLIRDAAGRPRIAHTHFANYP
jgi:hypothetical protein